LNHKAGIGAAVKKGWHVLSPARLAGAGSIAPQKAAG
jgi:hypothetical protein